jgi:hypothetical protein
MKKNNEKAVRIPDETIADLNKACEILEQAVDVHGVTFTPNERKSTQSTGAKRSPFVKSAREFASSNSKLLPGFVDIEEFVAHCDNLDVTTQLVTRLEGIIRQFKDIAIYEGNKALEPSNECLAAAARAVKRNVPGAEHALNKMREARRFGSKKPPKAQMEEAANEETLETVFDRR